MFVELNELRSVVVRPPAGALAHPEPWGELAERLRCAFLVGVQERAVWEGWARGRGCEVLPWSSGYLIPVKGNIRAALEALDAQPYEAVYLCFDDGELPEAISTRLGTLLVGQDPGDSLPDYVADDVADAVAVLNAVAGGSLHGYAAEVFGSVGHGSGRRHGFFLSEVAGIVPPEMVGRMDVVVTGRYFASGDARQGKHQPTYRLQRLKERAHYGLPFVPPLASVLRVIDGQRPIGAVTCVPARPGGGGSAPLAEVVARACLHEPGRPGRVPLRADILCCVRDYPPQKTLGSVSRRSNVRGAFAVSGARPPEHVVVVDDIITTGSTVSECARTLLAAGARFVTALCLGRDQSWIPQPDSAGALACQKPGCGGKLVMRLNSRTDRAFWGCSEYFAGGGSHTTVDWRTGLRAYNALNRRDDIEGALDLPF